MAFFSGLYHRFRGAFDPARLAVPQAFPGGDHGAAIEQFRQLREEQERLRMQERMKRKSTGPVGDLGGIGDGATFGGVDAVGAASRSPTDGRQPIAGFENGPNLNAPPATAEVGEAVRNFTPARAGKLDTKRVAPGTRAPIFSGSVQSGSSIRAVSSEPSLVDAVTGPAIEHVRNAYQRLDRAQGRQHSSRNTPTTGPGGRFGNAYTDPRYLPVEESLERELSLPSGILSAIRTRGERSNADQVSENGAQTVYQIIPATREALMRRYGVDPWAGPEQAARGAALLLRESYERQGDWNSAVLEYHGGTDRRNWGPRTRAYGARVGDFNGWRRSE